MSKTVQYIKIREHKYGVEKHAHRQIELLKGYAENGVVDLDFLFDVSMKVDDVCRYTVKVCANKFVLHKNETKDDIFNKSSFNDIAPIFEKPSLVIILESPHKYEYGMSENDEVWPKAPAQKETGDKIESLLEDLLNKSNLIKKMDRRFKEFQVILSNPVPYQTSLYSLHKKELNVPGVRTMRDKIWKILWPEVEDEFCALIKEYKAIAIVNACTFSLRGYVSDKLDSFYEGPVCIAKKHPSFWHKNLKLDFKKSPRCQAVSTGS
ncbi:hypothetical protein [Maridesulfovibrio sp.]|uniref:hypothetical protein n=1 Tax=Maridesulfovibrio sp. TaxID=2795000 RepID=UPI003BA94007